MSRIFEALQRSEPGHLPAEDPGMVDQLFQAAERDANPVLADLDHAPVLKPVPWQGSRLVALTDRESLAAEKFRYLGVKLRQLQQQRALKRLLITSSLPEEGKSMVAANLAATLGRRQRQRVLLIEGDLRRPVLAGQMGLGDLLGLAEWLQQEREEEPEGLEELPQLGQNQPGRRRDDLRREPSKAPPLAAIYQLEGAGFWFLPAGAPPENPLELLQSERMQQLMNQLAARFDWIIVDSPPLLPVADTSVWARLADGMLLVVREGKTEKRQLQRALAGIDAANVLGVVINSCSTTDEKHYYARYHRAQASAEKP